MEIPCFSNLIFPPFFLYLWSKIFNWWFNGAGLFFFNVWLSLWSLFLFNPNMTLPFPPFSSWLSLWVGGFPLVFGRTSGELLSRCACVSQPAWKLEELVYLHPVTSRPSAQWRKIRRGGRERNRLTDRRNCRVSTPFVQLLRLDSLIAFRPRPRRGHFPQTSKAAVLTLSLRRSSKVIIKLIYNHPALLPTFKQGSFCSYIIQ